jgi:PIN domain nuclease of toxin-antitoxin system
VNLVLDTQALVWYASGQLRRLGRRARRAFAQAEAARWTLRVPTIVLMEIALLEQKGLLRVSYQALRDQLAIRPGFPLELLPEDIDEARTLRILRDPFDRLIAGTALRLRRPLLTNDTAVARSGAVSVEW